MASRRAVLIGALALAAGAGPALAHRGHSVLSVVVIDPASGELTATHRFSAHDVEPTLVELAPDANPSLDDPAALEAFIAHIGESFRVDGQPLAFLGSDLRGDDVALTYRGMVATPVRAVRIVADLLPETDAGEEPEVQVNVRVGRVTRTLVFLPGDGEKTATFGAA